MSCADLSAPYWDVAVCRMRLAPKLCCSRVCRAFSASTALSALWLLLQAVISLMEMGFDEKEVIDALRVNNNQQNAAVSTRPQSVGP